MRAILCWVKMRRLSKLGLVVLVGLVLAGVSAHAALRAIVEQSSKSALAALPPQGYEAEDHFPGAAYLYAEEAQTAPALPGTTSRTCRYRPRRRRPRPTPRFAPPRPFRWPQQAPPTAPARCNA